MAISVIAIALVLTFFRKNENFKTLLQSMLWVLFAYLALSSTVHPWYIIFLLTLSLFTNYKFPILWTLVVILSYWAYSNSDFTENLWLLGIEYLTVFAFLIYELTTKSSKKLDFFKKHLQIREVGINLYIYPCNERTELHINFFEHHSS